MNEHAWWDQNGKCGACGATDRTVPCKLPKPLWLVGSKLLDGRPMSVVEADDEEAAARAYAVEIDPWIGGKLTTAEVRERYSLTRIFEEQPAAYSHNQLGAAITVAGLFTPIGRRLREMWRRHPEYQR